MVVVHRNWRCRYGEIDIVARDAGTLVFCEVKTRRGTAFGVPLDAITRQKVTRLRRLVSMYLAQEGGHPGPVRIDAVGILWGRDDRLGLEHLRGVA
jgi:putative endonuclease